MNPTRRVAVIASLVFSAAVMSATATTLNTVSVNFALDGNGGGATGILNGTQTVEMFCIDFANEIWVPYEYTVNLTTPTSGADLSHTRFGGVTNWTSINIAGDVTDSTVINNANALGRYQMVAYLTALYHLGDTPANNSYNNGIQEAIWEILNPADALNPPGIASSTTALQAAANWYANTTTVARDSFLANFQIISDVNMTTANCSAGAKCGGFQEQMHPDPNAPVVPEPRSQALVLLGAFSLCAVAYRSRKQAALSK